MSCGNTHQTATHHFRKAKKQQFAGCAERWEKDADYRECMHGKQPHVRNDGKLASHRMWATENPPNDAATKTIAIRESVVHC